MNYLYIKCWCCKLKAHRENFKYMSGAQNEYPYFPFSLATLRHIIDQITFWSINRDGFSPGMCSNEDLNIPQFRIAVVTYFASFLQFIIYCCTQAILYLGVNLCALFIDATSLCLLKNKTTTKQTNLCLSLCALLYKWIYPEN